MICNLTLMVPAVIAGLLFYFGISKLVETIPLSMMLSWRRDAEEIVRSEIDRDIFKTSTTFKLIFSLASAAIVAAISFNSQLSIETYGYIVFFMIVMLVVGINFKHQLLPDILLVPMIWLGLLFHAYLDHNLELYLYGSVAAYFIPFSIYWFFKLVTGKEIVGYGDFKMFALLGAWFGLAHVLSIAVLFIAFTLISVIVGALKNGQQPIGTGITYLLTSLIVYFYGAII